ncbi:hypothetical protein MHAS44199_05265 [Mycolicibacterium hassiacum DSM 44199]|nr:hypothetical protein [Mycolicibacterium hassiacum DSM 44199]
MAHFMGDSVTDDAELTLAIGTASRSVDRITGRQFGLLDAPESRRFSARYDSYRRHWVIDTDDFATTDGVTVETSTPGGLTPITAYLPTPVNAVVNGGVWTQVVIDSGSAIVPTAAEGGVRVTARWGWPAIPPTIKLATLIQASRLFARRHAPFGVAGNPEVGQLRLLERLDPDVAISVRPFARVWGAV